MLGLLYNAIDVLEESQTLFNTICSRMPLLVRQFCGYDMYLLYTNICRCKQIF